MEEAKEYFEKWAEKCRIFTNHAPIYNHKELLDFGKSFAEHYHEKEMEKLQNNFHCSFYERDKIQTKCIRPCGSEMCGFLNNTKQ